MNENQKFIDGSWYDEAYSPGGRYGIYDPEHRPAWADETNRYYAGTVASILDLFPVQGIKILDLGSGMGHYVRTWRDLGYLGVRGIEISQVAVDKAVAPGIIQGSVNDLSMFGDDEFDLVFSSALMEHIDDSILEDSVREMSRVGRTQVHMLSELDGGEDEDPSHINKKLVKDWFPIFYDLAVKKDIGQAVLAFEDFIFKEYWYLVVSPPPWPRQLHALVRNLGVPE